MQTVRVIQAYADLKDAHAPGDLLTVDERTAIELIATGLAERAEAHPDQPEACVKPDCCKATRKAAKR
jgi:hypothetical protein